MRIELKRITCGRRQTSTTSPLHHGRTLNRACWAWAGGLLAMAWVCSAQSSGQKLRLEFQPEWAGQPLRLNQQMERKPGGEFFISRLDSLISQLAVQRLDGTWLETDQWHFFLSVGQKRLSATATGLPAQEFKALRFRVGLDPKTDAGDAQIWPAEHALHPDVCGLHWGWSSGYVFLALEGQWQPEPARSSGFSYHLAGAQAPMWVELPVKFSGGQPTTIRLGMEVSAVLAGGAVWRESSSTHSRDGDGLALQLKGRVAKSFSVKSVEKDVYQVQARLPDATPPPSGGTTPFSLKISERLPKVKLPPDNPLSVEGVELGRQLFHDPRLSRNNSQACASCHERDRGFTDGKARSLGAGGHEGRRNAMPLANLAWEKDFFWDGRARTLREQVLMPIQDAHEMNETLERVTAKLSVDENYRAGFRSAFGSADITTHRVALALEQFLLTLISQDSKFDRAAKKLASLTPQEQRGLQLFVTENDPARGLRGADCFHCHGGNLFRNGQFMNNGLEGRAGDRGRMEVTGLESDRGKFKVPSLRNVALTAPYMHDGRFSTLEEVVEHYNGPLHRSPTLDPNLAKHPPMGLGLSSEDKAALVSFLKTLTDETLTGVHASPQLTKAR